jgi:hypothetical protein
VDGLHQAAGSSADLVVEVHGSTQDSLKLDVGIYLGIYDDLWQFSATR